MTEKVKTLVAGPQIGPRKFCPKFFPQWSKATTKMVQWQWS